MKRKAQAALEFLMTYGWAFLVILVMIGALAYFGVLSPTRLLPERCTVTAGFQCEEFEISSTGVVLYLKNGLGTAVDVKIADYNASHETGDANGYTINGGSSDVVVQADETFYITYTGMTNLEDLVGQKTRVNIEATYVPVGKNLDKKITGEVFGEVVS